MHPHPLRNISWFVLLILAATISYTLEQKQLAEDHRAIARTATVLAPALWNLDKDGPVEYLKIACKLNNYQKISIFDDNNLIFRSVEGPQESPVEHFFLSLGLIPKIKLSAAIYHNGTKVGKVVAIHLHNTIYKHIYILLTLGLTAILVQYFLNSLTAHKNLNERVRERTEKLAQSEARYREIFNAPSDAIVIHDAKTGSVLDVNRGLVGLLGYSREEIINLGIKDFSSGTHPYTKEMAQEKIRKTLEEGPQLFEWRCMKKNGELIWVEVALKAAEFGGKQYLIAVTRDISSRHKVEMARRESEIKYRTLIETTGTGYVILTESGTVLDANSEYVKLSGHAKLTEIIGQSVLTWTAAHHRARNDVSLENCLSTGLVRNLEIDYVTEDGSILPVEINGSVMVQKGEKVILAMVKDISQRKEAERSIAEEQERLAVTLRSIGDGVITTDINGRVTMLNTVAEQLTGWSQGDAAGKPLHTIFRIVNEKTKEPCDNPAKKVINTGKIIGLANHTALIARNGSMRSIADSGAPIRDRDGRVIGVVLVFRDVTEKQRMEQEALKARKLESVGVLAGGIAHDFNNILAAILGNINLAMGYSPPHSPISPLLAEAEKASLRAKDLTQQLLTFSKGGEPVIKSSSIAEIIKDSSSFVLRGSSVRCDTSFAPDLRRVAIDPGQISQVIQNLIINAAHAMPQGGVVNIRCENVAKGQKIPRHLEAEHYIVVTVKDSGVGIPNSIIDHIFDPYFSTKQKGSGLGLAISHSIISKHGGSIGVVSSPETGTTFTIYLPASQQQLEDLPLPVDSTSTEGHAKIMIMDDDKMVRNVAKAMLKRRKFEVQCTADGEEALELYRKELATESQADIIIMDLTIPGRMGGEETVQKILEIHPEAKVIVSSGYSNDPIMANFKEYGFSEAIVKPYQATELYALIRQVLNS